jgi:Nif-specific regulatory protein
MSSSSHAGISSRGDPDHAGEVRKLSTLLDASQALSATTDLNHGLRRVLEILGRHHGAVRGTVALLDEDGDEMALHQWPAAALPAKHERQRIAAAITGPPLKAGKPIVVPRVSSDPAFAARLAPAHELDNQELSYVAVPIVSGGRPAGLLGVDLPFKPGRDYHRTAKFLAVVGSMIGQAVRVGRLIHADRQRLLDENTHLRQELKERYDFSNLVGTSAPMRLVYEQITHVARANTTVLLRGESGTGKELIAHALHYNSPRARKPFVKVSCAALPHELIESELFGYEKGAFTGAVTQKKGRLEVAEGGTLFLDEIGEINLATQVKLLRVLQEREFERLGGLETIAARFRLIAATNTHLEQSIAAGQFREDLFYRLNVFPIFVPPLRERKADLLLLADHFLEKFAREHGKVVKRISTPAIDMLTSYHWPGNVRELANVIERAVVVCDAQVVHSHHLPPTLQTAEASGTTPTATLRESMEAVEKDAILDALKSARGNRAKAARLVGTTERIFNYRVRKYGIDCQRFK